MSCEPQMDPREQPSLVAFVGDELVERGAPPDVALALKRRTDPGEERPVLVFDAVTSRPFELDLRGTDEEVRARLAPPPVKGDGPTPTVRRGPGRPKLGVVAREVTLLPRHWEWLAEQPGSASVTLRRLVDAARKEEVGKVSLRRAQESAYRFLSVMAGDAVGFEEAIRALFAGDAERFRELIGAWPADVRRHAKELAGVAFAAAAEAG
ncbi:MAG: DUF2239 family protein [Acidobacteriota bacterium]